MFSLLLMCKKLERWCLNATTHVGWKEQQSGTPRRMVLMRSSIFMGAIATMGRMIREYEATVGRPLIIHIVIVDECGCTSESPIALILKVEPNNIVLVGDHKQLPPTSKLNRIEGTGHCRSLLERCVSASNNCHLLEEQYRCNGLLGDVVSHLF